MNPNIVKSITSLEYEKESRGIPNDEPVTMEDIATDGGILPMFIVPDFDPNENATEIIFSESISGGADSIDGMPREVSLTKLELIDGQWHKSVAPYILKGV